jgi:hypothetical protein
LMEREPIWWYDNLLGSQARLEFAGAMLVLECSTPGTSCEGGRRVVFYMRWNQKELFLNEK